MNRNIDLIGFGDPFLDLVIGIGRLPESNTNCPINDYCFQGGGNVATALCTASVLGLKTELVGSVGDDLFGKMSLADLKYNNVGISKMAVEKGTRSNFSICVTESELQGKEFMSSHGDFCGLNPSDIDAEFIKSARMLHVGLITPAVVRACEIIHESGGKVSIDAPYYKPHVYENYRHFDIFIGSEMYYSAMCESCGYDNNEYEKNMKAVQCAGPDIVIFTFGGDGCRGVSGEKYFELPSFKVEAADTTGAGDVFHGAFDYAYLRGWDAEKCARFASGASAVKCTRPGGRCALPSLEVLEKFLESGKIDYTEIDKRSVHYKNGISIGEEENA